jgi:hypothetical protein
MYEEIRKPKLLKDIPSILIRPLPSIYYYSNYANIDIPQELHNFFVANVNYLSMAIKKLGGKLKIREFNEISNSVQVLSAQSKDKMQAYLEKTTIELAQLCTEHRSTLRHDMVHFKTELNKLYKEIVPSLKILVVDSNGQSEKVSKLTKMLSGFCLYDADQTSFSAGDYPKKQIISDFVVFTSVSSPEIHDHVKSLQTYQKPGLAIVHIEKDADSDKQSIRHGSQLLKIGFPVLFKIFTPIRLYTTIDKNYMRFHLKH